jgi:succinyl-CoA synthetase alpha subunit
LAILVDSETRVVVQGITGRQGSFHARLMKEYGTKVVAGVSPGKGGQELWGIPVYDSVDEAVSAQAADTSAIYVPAPNALEAGLEALRAGIRLVVIITEGIPPLDTMRLIAYAKSAGARILGPNCPGVISPGLCKVGIMPAEAFRPGSVGIISRSGTLTYEIAWGMTQAGIGQSTVVGLGGDPVMGTSFVEVLSPMREDRDTNAVVIVGEIGGEDEERCAKFIADTSFDKPVVAYIAGRTAPSERRMGHAGAIISGGRGDYSSKVSALAEAGVRVVERPSQVPSALEELTRDSLKRGFGSKRLR